MFITITMVTLAIQIGFGSDFFGIGVLIFINSLFCILIIEVHMRYIDRIHYAKTELAKDRFIIKQYMKMKPNLQVT